MGIHGKYVNKKTHVSFLATNVGIHRKYVSFYSYGSFFVITNFEIWVYKRMKNDFLLETLKFS